VTAGTVEDDMAEFDPDDFDDSDDESGLEDRGGEGRLYKRRKGSGQVVYSIAAAAKTPAISNCINSRLFKWNSELVRYTSTYIYIHMCICICICMSM
jgi:hypothetical protein